VPFVQKLDHVVLDEWLVGSLTHAFAMERE
jgi:hypothetical protein